jgi:hypothetical protein
MVYFIAHDCTSGLVSNGLKNGFEVGEQMNMLNDSR